MSDEDTEVEDVGASVTLGGQTFVVNEELAQALKAEQESLKGQIRELGLSVESIRNQPVIKEEPKNYDEEIWTNPTGVLKNFGKELAEEIKSELRQEYLVNKSQNEMWDDFYSNYPQLKKEKWLVDAVMQRDMGELGPMNKAAALELLANRVSKELLRLSGNKKSSEAKVEGDGAPPARKEVEEEEAPKRITITDVLKQRRQARAAAS